MADILDDLEGILGKEAADKIRSAPLAQRLQRGDSVREYYDGSMEGEPPAPLRQQQQEPPARREAGGESLADVLGELGKITTRLGTLDQTVATEVNKVIEARGSELVGSAAGLAMRNVMELVDVGAQHRADFNEPLDRVALEAHADAAAKAGRPFRTVTEAYNDMTREARMNKQVEARVETSVREKLKERTTAGLPGVSGNAGSPMLRALKAVPNGGGNASAVSSAARALEDRLAERGEAVA